MHLRHACAHVRAAPDGDVLLHAGDLLKTGKLAELRTTIEWLRGLPHPTKTCVHNPIFRDRTS
jgi:3',5'-cyclic AMP phosphodiesterase CpdA